MRRFRRAILSGSALLLAGWLLVSAPGSAQAAARVINLSSRNSGALVARQYPVTNVRIEMVLEYTAPGIIFDTVGINGAPIGSFAAQVDGAHRLTFNVYDPTRSSEVQISNGWHIISGTRVLKPKTQYRVRIDVRPSGYQLWLNGRLERQVALATPLSGQPLYAGDFPGDDQWGPKYNIHPAMIGRLTFTYFGPIPDDTAAAAPEPKPDPAPVAPPGPERPVQAQVPTDTPQVLEAGVRRIENAFRAKNVDEILTLVAPEKYDLYRQMCAEHRDDLARIADLLGTRRLVATTASYAEFEVTDRGATFFVTFVRIDGVWCLENI